MRRLCLALVASAVLASIFSTPAEAIPAFARKYGTSCQTCHIAYPKLNAFGTAFRLRGYRMPGETEDQVKQPPVPLGAPAYKRVWPKAVWPGAIPSSVPISVALQFLLENTSRFEEGERETVHNDFIAPSEVELILGGTAGDIVSYFGEIEMEREASHGGIETETSVGHLDVRFIQPLGGMGFNFKVGSFQPELVSTFDHARRLTIANYDAMFGVNSINPGGATSVGGHGHHGGTGLSLPAVAEGVEFYGINRGRFFWNAGIVNGLGPGEETFDGNSAKDAYARLAYKWGGLALDGSNSEDYATAAKNWRERSFQLGIFGYWGDGEEILEFAEHGPTEQFFVEDQDFSRIGVDFNWFHDDLNIFGAYVDGEDELNSFMAVLSDPADPGSELEPGPLEEGESGTFKYDAFFVEIDYVMGYPWLHGALRYENVDLPGEEGGMPVEDFERTTAALIALVRANVKTVVEYSWDLNESKNYQSYVGLSIAF